MERDELKKVNQILVFSTIIIAALYFGASLLIPFAFAVLFATLVLPVSNLLERKLHMGRTGSSFVSTLLIFLGVGLMLFFLVRQVGTFLSDLMERREEILSYLQELQRNVADQTGLRLEDQEEMLKERLSGIFDATQKFLTSFLGDLFDFLLMLIYVFLLLLNRSKMVEFVMMYVPEDQEDESHKIIEKTRKVAHHYLWGRIQVMLLLGIMYLITFTAYGLEHTALLVVFGTIITIVPYVGPLLSGLLPILFIILYDHSTPAVISFAAIILVIQLIESYVLEPVLIGKEVQQNPLFVIIAVLLGGAIWGAAGLILFVPLFAILKIMFDHSRHLQPVGFLMGYEEGGSESFLDKIKRKVGF